MVSKDILHIMDRELKRITGNDSLDFGGKIVLFGGDFRQTLPIKEKATAEQLFKLSLKGSKMWPSFEIFKLEKNMRADPTAIQFAKDIRAIGEGKMNDEEEKVTIPDECIFEDDLLKEVFGDKITEQNFDSLRNRAVLAPTNKEVDEINADALDLVDGEAKTYYSFDEVREQDQQKQKYMVELLNTIDPPGMPKHELTLKKNAIIMLLRNLDIESGLCNGTRLQVLEMQPNVLKCKIITGDKAGQIVFIPRITLECNKGLPATFYRKQFPVRLAFAMTINKSQGQTFEKVGMKLDKQECFSHGQFYVGISRIKNWSCLKIKLDKDANKKTRNVVFRMVLN
jgi:hypothetical protein